MDTNTRVQLIEKPDDKYTTLRAGDSGTVQGYDPDTGLLRVNWDNGSRLPVSEEIVVELPKAELN